MHFAIRVDASVEIGLGHVKRCCALAHALAQLGLSVAFVTRDLGVDSAETIRREGFACTVLGAPPVAAALIDPTVPHAHWARVDAEEDARQTVTALAGQAVDWVIVDHYSFDARWHRAVAGALGARIAAIDDLGDRSLDVAVVIDHNQAADHRLKYAGHVAPGVQILGGPGHALLAPVYENAPRYAFNATVRSIGIFTGGTDRDNYSAKALRAIREGLRFEGDVEIVTTRSNPNLAALRDEAAMLPGTLITVDLPDLSGFFARHDLHVGAAGGATWERCCIGAPALALCLADNQRHVALPLQYAGVLQVATTVPPTIESIARELGTLMVDETRRAGLASQGPRLVDGRGARRVATHFIES